MGSYTNCIQSWRNCTSISNKRIPQNLPPPFGTMEIDLGGNCHDGSLSSTSNRQCFWCNKIRHKSMTTQQPACWSRRHPNANLKVIMGIESNLKYAIAVVTTATGLAVAHGGIFYVYRFLTQKKRPVRPRNHKQPRKRMTASAAVAHRRAWKKCMVLLDAVDYWELATEYETNV